MADIKLFVFVTLALFSLSVCTKYQPTWESLDTRPIPGWYDDVKLGIFIHWGVFSVPSFKSEWFWWYWKGTKNPDVVDFMKENFRPDFTYADFASKFTTEFFVPEEWAEIFKASGARYVVLTSKHHEGFTNWPSKYSFNWNSNATGPNRDLVGELANAIRDKTDIKFGLYHSMFEWFNPLYLQDKANNFSTNNFVQNKNLPELFEIVEKYKPEVVWSDGDWEAPDTYWKSTQYLSWLYNESPVKDTVVVNDRWGSKCACHHGGFYTCGDRFNPGVLQKHKWENAMTIDKYSWGFRRNARLADFLTIEELLKTFVGTVSCGGNMLMNIGPTHDGRIAPIFEERLRQMGSWLNVNGEGIYGTRPWSHQNDTATSDVWYTMKKFPHVTAVYAVALQWPDTGVLKLGAPTATSATVVSLLGYPGNLNYTRGSAGGLSIQIPPIPFNKMPCDWAWTFKMTGLSN
ncbi:alpha-L-fucosidase-like isoform X2 [Mizuhopecten yessoensis]|uniref:alpha-L-fucosidase n=1 Tax=Mizuhopecten yessoensis TaxID=6573 RepID=A0A210PFL4_MIZYE|nr:alpha-L-fucosidase-like isoform X2 [Mizuhopecten yessoensis]OWF35293.1 Alpha-L-fucosidase [Mizuhopecten yessoensis]